MTTRPNKPHLAKTAIALQVYSEHQWRVLANPNAFRKFAPSRQHCVPEGHMTIAQRFNAGFKASKPPKPRQGRPKPGYRIVLSPLWGYRPFTTRSPALKRWAILGCPFGTNRS